MGTRLEVTGTLTVPGAFLFSSEMAAVPNPFSLGHMGNLLSPSVQGAGRSSDPHRKLQVQRHK